MQIIGLAGPARSGKDTIANHLKKAHGFEIFSFSDKLYDEVATAFDVNMALLKSADTKDSPHPLLRTSYCKDRDFAELAEELLWRQETNKPSAFIAKAFPWTHNLSPRWVLQVWGTEYRRAQNPEYWINASAEWLLDRMNEYGKDVMHFRAVNTSVRYPNEVKWLRDIGGQVWHVYRNECPLVRAHSSEVPVAVDPDWDNVLHNDGSINSLWSAVSLLAGTRAYGQTVSVTTEEEAAS